MKKNLISLSSLSKDEFRQWQLSMLDILVYFRDFCIEHNLRFFLSAGSCIGAIRHKGFIPWDGDIDVIMPRDDYDKLLSLWNQFADTNRYECCITTEKQTIGFPMILIRSKNTTCIYDHSKQWDICHGMKLDVEHYDGMPKGKINQNIQYVESLAFALFRTQRVPNQKSRFIKTLSKVILTLFRNPKICYKISEVLEKQIKKYDCKTAEYVRYLNNAPMKREFFDNVLWVDFEGTPMPIPENYHEFLQAEYGDYMKLPPVEAQKPKTDCLAFYDLKNGYEKYKGIHYCVNPKYMKNK